jgi:hypothetical protein
MKKFEILIILLLSIFKLNGIFVPSNSSYVYTIGRSFSDKEKGFIGYNWPCFQIFIRLSGEGEIFM